MAKAKHRKSVRHVLTVAAIVVISAVAWKYLRPTTLPPPLETSFNRVLPADVFPDVTIGGGFDALKEVPARRCIQFDFNDSNAFETQAPDQGGSVNQVLHRIEDEESFNRVMNFSASLSAKGWGSSGKASYQRFQDEHRSSYKLYYLIGFEFRSPTQVLKDHPYTAEAEQALAKGPDAFYRLCGTEWVRSVDRGGSYLALLESNVNTFSSTESERASLEFSISGFLNGDGSRTEEIKNRHSNKSLRILLAQIGGAATDLSVDPDRFIANANAWKDGIQKGQRTAVFRLRTSPYRHAKYGTVPLSIQNQMDSLRSGTEKLARLRALKANVDYVRDHPEEFVVEERAKFLPGAPSYADRMFALEQSIERCRASADNCSGIDTFEIPTITLPTRLEWSVVNPTSAGKHTIGWIFPGDSKVVVFVGEWSMWHNNPGLPMHSADTYEDKNLPKHCGSPGIPPCGIFVTFTTQDGQQVGAEHRIKNGQVIPPQASKPVRVEYRIADQSIGDNGINPNNPLRVAILPATPSISRLALASVKLGTR